MNHTAIGNHRNNKHQREDPLLLLLRALCVLRGQLRFRLTMKHLLAALCFALACQFAAAGEATPLAADPVAEKRVQALSEELRCLVCQNQSIADSHAELATDLKREIRTMIQTGKSDKEIVDFMVTRYGDFILYKPPVKATTLFLWSGPLLFMAIGFFTLVRYLRRRDKKITDDAPLSAEESQRADELLRKLP